jgi:hypothetical protein
VAKYALSENAGMVGLSYTPWMLQATNGAYHLFYLTGFYKLGKQSISASVRYMLEGSMDFRNENNTYNLSEHPSQYAFDLGYSRAFGNYFSIGLALRYLSVNKTEEANNSQYLMARTGAFAGDLGFYFQHPSGKNNEYAIGLSLKNIGTKLDMGGSKIFLPMAMNLGGRYSIGIQEKHQLVIAADISKPLVPEDQTKNVFGGLFESFGNNIQEWGLSGGFEYAYTRRFFARLGYHLGSADGQYANGSYISTGLGVMGHGLSVDFSYMISTSNNRAMTNTFRVALQYAFGRAATK